jgi:hypothetical protein
VFMAGKCGLEIYVDSGFSMNAMYPCFNMRANRGTRYYLAIEVETSGEQKVCGRKGVRKWSAEMENRV